LLRREDRLRKAKKVWEMFLNDQDAETIARKLNLSQSQVLSIVNYTTPEFYKVDLSNTLMAKLENQEDEINSLRKSLDNSRNMGWIPVSVGVFIASVAIIIAIVIVMV
jgi:hypothetical protein